ncbi:MAG TPA: PA14 domain-containing protein [Planctomycetota bacterium]|nr:PA14 domain-containing protein [Planctomycetota bacterium]
MRTTIHALLLALLLCASHQECFAAAQPPPEIKTFTPEFVQRGQSTEVTVTGNFLAPGTKLIVTGEGGINSEIVEATPAKLRLKLSAGPHAAVGDRELRVETPAGVSNPIAFTVGLFPMIAEKEPNNSASNAQVLELPVTVTGAINAATEVDNFRVKALKGEQLVFDVQAARIGSKLDPTIGLFDLAGRQIAIEQDSAGVDPVIRYTVPQNGEYILRVHDVKYGGGGDFTYRLTAGKVPYAEAIFPMGGQRGTTVNVAFSGPNLEPGTNLALKIEAAQPLGRMDVQTETPFGPTNAMAFEVSDTAEFIEKEPNSKVNEANTVTLPVILNGRINQSRDVDIYKFTPAKGQKLVFEVTSGRLGSPVDPLLTLLNAKGDILAQNETDGRLEFTFNDAAEYAISIADLHDREGANLVYRLAVQPPAAVPPSFSVRFQPDRVRISRGSNTKIWAEVVRTNNYDGDVTIGFENLPKGITCEPVVFHNAPAPSGIVVLSAAADADIGSFPVRLVASSKHKDQSITRYGEAELNNRVVRQAFLTVMDKPAFTIEAVEGGDEKDLSALKPEIEALQKRLDTTTPEFTAALAKWEASALEGTRWTILEPEKLISAAYAKTEKRKDGSILVSGGNPAKDSYKLIVTTKMRGITAFQLEALSDPSLPAGGPGRAENGNFVLTHFKVDAAAPANQNNIVSVQFAKVTADFAQQNFPPENALLGKPDTGWAIHPQMGKTHTAIFFCKEPVDYEGGAVLTFNVDCSSVHNQHSLGCFRISATTDKNPGGGKMLPANVKTVLETPADKRTDAQKKELVDYYKSLDPDLKGIEERLADMKKITALRYPPHVSRATPGTLVARVKRDPGFTADITVSAEGYSPGRDPKTMVPNTIAKSVEVKPVTLKADQTLAILSLRPVPKGDTGVRTIVLKGEARGADMLEEQYSKSIPLSVGASLPDNKPKEADKPKGTLVAGLDYNYYEGDWDLIPDFDGMTPKEKGTTEKFDLSKKKRDDQFGIKFTGYIDIKKEGNYTFFTASDDGSRLYIGPYEVVDNDGLHGADEKKGDIKLKVGKHAISVHYFEKSGGEALTVSYQGPDVAKQEIPPAVLFREQK